METVSDPKKKKSGTKYLKNQVLTKSGAFDN